MRVSDDTSHTFCETCLQFFVFVASVVGEQCSLSIGHPSVGGSCLIDDAWIMRQTCESERQTSALSCSLSPSFFSLTPTESVSEVHECLCSTCTIVYYYHNQVGGACGTRQIAMRARRTVAWTGLLTSLENKHMWKKERTHLSIKR